MCGFPLLAHASMVLLSAGVHSQCHSNSGEPIKGTLQELLK